MAIKNIRALHLVKTSKGASWALRQIRELVKLGVEVHVALPPGPLVSEYQQVGVIVHLVSLDFPVREPWRWPRLFKEIRNLVIRIHPDIIHSHHVGTTITMRLGLRGLKIPRIFQVPGPLHLEHPVFRSLEIALADERDYWIGSCKYTCDLYKRFGVKEDRIFLSYYGVDLENFGGRQGRLREFLGIGKDVKLVGMVAYMYAPKWFLGQTRGLKGHEDFIDAIKLASLQRKDLVAVIIGGAWDKAWYERKIRDYGKKRCGAYLTFLGARNDVPHLYPDLDVAVHPSHSENVGGAVESLLFGIPTIATRVGGLPEVVIDGLTGWLVPPKKPALLAATILEVLQDLDKGREMAERGRALVHQLFNVKRTAAEVADVYEQLLSRNP
jgi:glycosyltransferase involved in cell wall biosynthesis